MLLLIFTKTILLLSFYLTNFFFFFHENYFYFFMFRDVPGCSGMSRVPDFIDARLVFTLYNVVRGLSFIFDPLSWGMVMYDNKFVL